MLSRKLVKLHTFELTDIPQVLGQNWENFVSHAPILVIFFTFVLVMDMRFKATKRRRRKFEPRVRVWKLKEEKTCEEFRCMVGSKMERSGCK